MTKKIKHSAPLFDPASNYMFKVNKKSTRERNKICSKLTIKTSIVFIVNFEQGNAGWGRFNNFT